MFCIYPNNYYMKHFQVRVGVPLSVCIYTQWEVSSPSLVWSYSVEREEHKPAELSESHDCKKQWPQACQLPARNRGKNNNLDLACLLGSFMAVHKISYFSLQIKVVNEEIYKRTFEDIVRTLDKLENECIPSVSLSQREVHCITWRMVINLFFSYSALLHFSFL